MSAHESPVVANAGTDPRRARAVVVADADSYLKWAVSRALELRDEWDVELVVVRSAVTPSPAQIAAAVDGRWNDVPEPESVSGLCQRLRDHPPAVLILACRGPLIDLIARRALTSVPRRTVLLAGIPGIWLPPTELGVRLRSSIDMMIVHSTREREELARLVAQIGRGPAHIGLASLATDSAGEAAPSGDGARESVVFAPQALVPRAVEDRRRILQALARTAHSHPELDVVIKERGRIGEEQTHRTAAPFEELLAHLEEPPPNLMIRYGSLREHLDDCRGLVTVSSTAVLESVAAGVPSLCLEDFGVGDETITTVFVGSGLLGDLDDLQELRFRLPEPSWSERNYFHGTAHDDWLAVLADLVARASDHGMPPVCAEGTGSPWSIRHWRLRYVALGKEAGWPAFMILRAASWASLARTRISERRHSNQR